MSVKNRIIVMKKLHVQIQLVHINVNVIMLMLVMVFNVLVRSFSCMTSNVMVCEICFILCGFLVLARRDLW